MNKRIVFINQIPKEFKRHKKFIEEAIDYLYNALKLKVEVKIKFDNLDSIVENEKTDALLLNKSINRHEVRISNDVLKTISSDGGGWFYQSVYHEFEHIKDYVKMMQTKQFDFNFCLAHHAKLERAYVSKGFEFWTEIYAYYQTLKMTQHNDLEFESIPFGGLVKNYRKLIERDKNLYYKQDIKYEEAEGYIKAVNSFVYQCSRYMAAVYADHSRIPHKKIASNEDYQKVYSILVGLEKKIKGLRDDAYNKKSYANLFKLGKYIYENIEWKIFNVGMTKKNGRFFPVY